MRPDQRARAGIGWVPQERNIFRSLTVEENMTAVAQPGPWTVARVYEMFPRLKERRSNFGNQLSGGEQQMLAIGRALTLNPKVLLLDEPTEGLAPIIVEELLRALGTITRAGGICSIIVEQNAQKILGLADRVVILERGAIVHDAASAALKADPAVLERFLGVSGGCGALNRISGVKTMQRTKAPFRADEVGSLLRPPTHQGGAREAGEGRDFRRRPAQGRGHGDRKGRAQAGIDRPEARDRRRIPPLLVAFRLSGQV